MSAVDKLLSVMHQVTVRERDDARAEVERLKSALRVIYEHARWESEDEPEEDDMIAALTAINGACRAALSESQSGNEQEKT